MSNSEVTENKGQDAQRSDNGVYDYIAALADELSFGGIGIDLLALAEIESVRDCPCYGDTTRFSPSQPNQTPAKAIVREDEK